MNEKTYPSLKAARKKALLEIQNTNPKLCAEILRNIRKERHNRFIRMLNIICFTTILSLILMELLGLT